MSFSFSLEVYMSYGLYYEQTAAVQLGEISPASELTCNQKCEISANC